MIESKNNNRNGYLVFSPATARYLLRTGETIKDLLPDKRDPDCKRTVFIFNRTDSLIEKIEKIKQNNKQNKEGDVYDN